MGRMTLMTTWANRNRSARVRWQAHQASIAQGFHNKLKLNELCQL